MKRDELLTKLAMEMGEWPVTADEAKRVMPEGWYWRGDDGAIHVGGGVESFVVTAPDWLQRRAELINKPSWDDAPEWAQWLAQDANGLWFWHEDRPCRDGRDDDFDSNGKLSHAEDGTIPTGHNWRDTLEKRPTHIKTCRHCDTSFQRPSVTGIPDDRCERCHEEIAAMGWDEGCADAIGQNGPTGDHYMTPDEEEMPASTRHDCPRCGGCYYSPPHDECPCQPSATTADGILEAARKHMQDRAATYDKPEGERSMGATVDAFRAVTGIELSEEQGWLFMQILKAVRSQQGAYRADSYEDGAAYVALAGEAAAKERL